MSLPKLNYKHINKIVKHIAGNVKRLYMPTWGVKKGSQEASWRDLPNKAFPECNTTACFAGWSKLLSMPKKEWDSIFTPKGAMHVIFGDDSIITTERIRLGLTESEATALFDGTFGTPATQFKIVKQRLRYIVSERIELGDEDARKIKL